MNYLIYLSSLLFNKREALRFDRISAAVLLELACCFGVLALSDVAWTEVLEGVDVGRLLSTPVFPFLFDLRKPDKKLQIYENGIKNNEAPVENMVNNVLDWSELCTWFSRR